MLTMYPITIVDGARQGVVGSQERCLMLQGNQSRSCLINGHQVFGGSNSIRVNAFQEEIPWNSWVGKDRCNSGSSGQVAGDATLSNL